MINSRPGPKKGCDEREEWMCIFCEICFRLRYFFLWIWFEDRVIVDRLRKTAGPKRHRLSFLVVILLLVMASSICL